MVLIGGKIVSEETFYMRIECKFVTAVAIDKVIEEDRIATEGLWDVSEEVSD